MIDFFPSNGRVLRKRYFVVWRRSGLFFGKYFRRKAVAPMLPLSPISPTVFFGGKPCHAGKSHSKAEEEKDNLEFPNEKKKSRMKHVSMSLLFAVAALVGFVLKIARAQKASFLLSENQLGSCSLCVCAVACRTKNEPRWRKNHRRFARLIYTIFRGLQKKQTRCRELAKVIPYSLRKKETQCM